MRVGLRVGNSIQFHHDIAQCVITAVIDEIHHQPLKWSLAGIFNQRVSGIQFFSEIIPDLILQQRRLGFISQQAKLWVQINQVVVALDQLLAKGMNRTDVGNRQPVDLIAQMTVVGLFFQTAPNPLTHVIGGFVGKSNHQQLIDIEIRILFQHFDNAVNQYRCLPRAS